MACLWAARTLCWQLALTVHAWVACLQSIIEFGWARIADHVLNARHIAPGVAQLVCTIAFDPAFWAACSSCCDNIIEDAAGLPNPATIRLVGNAGSCWHPQQV
jgi:hypothetical protein